MGRVAFLLNNTFEYDARVKREAETLASTGYEVSLFCVCPEDGLLPTYEVSGGVSIFRIFSKPLQTFKPVTLRHVRALSRMLRGNFERFDIVHAHDSNTLLLGWVLSRYWKARLVYDSHELWESVFHSEQERLSKKQGQVKGKDASRIHRKIGELEKASRMEAWLIKRCDAIISVNDSICRLLSDKAQAGKKQVVPIRNMPPRFNQPDKHRKKFHEAFALPEQTRVLLYQGDIKPARGVEQLLDIMERLTTPDVALVLMGPVPDNAYYEHLQQRLKNTPNFQGRVFHKTSVPVNELLGWTSSADLGIAPLLNTRANNYYCLPNKLFEYIQAEIPCATSNFPEMEKIVTQYDVGFTFDPANINDAAQKLSAFLEYPEAAERYIENTKLAKQKLCWENEQQKLLGLYDTLTTGSRSDG